jgi:hypothetical protein
MISITFIRVTGKVTLVLGHSLTFQFDLPLWLQALFHCNLRVFIKREKLGLHSWTGYEFMRLARPSSDEALMSTSQGAGEANPQVSQKMGPSFWGSTLGRTLFYVQNWWNYKVWHNRCVTNHSLLHQIWLSFKQLMLGESLLCCCFNLWPRKKLQ